MQAHDEGRLGWALPPILMLTPFAHARKRAVQFGNFLEVSRLNLRSARVKLPWGVML